MKPCASYIQLLLSLICAHTLLYFTFDNTSVFWYLYTASMLFCISFAIGIGKLSSKYNNVSLKNILLGIGTGAALFSFFYVSMQLMDWLHLSSLTKDVSRLYKIYQPELVFHYIVLFLIIIPSEEIFWRGYIQTKLSEKFRALISIPLSKHSSFISGYFCWTRVVSLISLEKKLIFSHHLSFSIRFTIDCYFPSPLILAYDHK